ncbi:uncharacterized protein N7506_003443 [Penicillium brevicompactum]|uniref:uncharacterized protein n=1 Tax=Penicillium brevicompactum TaxID=5074 RepID=UPI0025419FCE|nr:uncharacterized protein N7506_003443 [Penicillium brevicompactum]KAJ5343619.1 hypothetical protein N7506_003443 [Penicillium brevicompactum]
MAQTNGVNGHGPPGPDQGASPIPSFVGEPYGGDAAIETLRGDGGVLELLWMVEQELGALREVLLTSDASDAAQAEAERIRANIRYFLRRVSTLLRDLDSQL